MSIFLLRQKIKGFMPDWFMSCYVATRQALHGLLQVPHIAAIRKNIEKTRAVIRRKVAGGKKIKVLFLVSSTSKWKSQSVYDLMAKDPLFEPCIAVMRQDETMSRSVDEVRKSIADVCSYFKERGCKVVVTYDADADRGIELSQFSPDLIFYQQPWHLAWTSAPDKSCQYALSCYVPYFIRLYSAGNYDSFKTDFHRELAYHFVLNESDVRNVHRWTYPGYFAGALVPVGHPILDDFYLQPIGDRVSGKCVIYAPHFSFYHPQNQVSEYISTFLDTGDFMLAYAKKHSEINWIFKPHPSLIVALRETGAWSESRIEKYFAGWKVVGEVCTNGDYMPLFRRATAMVTDSASFLAEFAVTGRPIIRLISKYDKSKMPAYINTYYQAHTVAELQGLLLDVVEKGNDYNRNERLSAIRNEKLMGQYAAKNIVQFLKDELCVTEGKK